MAASNHSGFPTMQTIDKSRLPALAAVALLVAGSNPLPTSLSRIRGENHRAPVARSRRKVNGQWVDHKVI